MKNKGSSSMFMKLFQILKVKKLFILFILPFSLFASSPIMLSFAQVKESQSSARIVVKITNYSTKEIKILKWNTPLETKLNANIFNVSFNNKSVEYTGKVVKRSKPTEDDYIRFASGEQQSITINLSDYYAMQKEGNYTVTYRGIFKYKDLSKQKVVTAKFLKSSLPHLDIVYMPSQKKTLLLQKVPANFNGCTQSQIVDINAAHDESIRIAKDASDVMNQAQVNTTSQRYNTWFGTPNSTRQGTVTTHFSNIYNALDTKNIGFDCTCTDNYFAYVYANQPYTIYLCTAFWSATVSGTDSKSGTIIHEMSHFTILAGTDDYVYGQADAKALAVSNPNQAIDNADNHEYFAENTPYLSMDNFFDTAVSITDIINDLPLNEDIAIAGEKDLYSFIASQSSQYIFSTTGTLDTIGTLYDSNYVQLIENDDFSDLETNFRFSYTLEAGERYYLSVHAYDVNVGAYTLQSSVGKSVSEFVERFYLTILNRPSDANGLQNWVKQLVDGTKAASDIAKGFINSTEFTSRNLDDITYVTVLYQAFFNRVPDTFGLNGWLSKLSSGASRGSALDGFLASQEFKNLAEQYGIKVALTPVEQFVTRFYEQCLLRTPDSAGLKDWATQLSSGNKSGADIARGFILSVEFKNRALNNADYLSILYRAFFGREADSAGFNNWLIQLNGGVSRENVLNGFLGAVEFSNLAASYGIRVN